MTELRHTPSMPRGAPSVAIRAPGKTERDRQKSRPALRDLRDMCATIGQTPAADDDERLMNARMHGPRARKLG